MDDDLLDDDDDLDMGEDIGGEDGETGYREVEIREQDRYLPVANIARIMKKLLPVSTKVGKDAKESIQGCVSEFISFITSEASDKCQQEKRKTINGDDLLWAMGSLGFEKYVEPLKVYLAKYRDAARGDKPEKKQYVRKEHAASSSSSSGSSSSTSNNKTVAGSFPVRTAQGAAGSSGPGGGSHAMTGGSQQTLLQGQGGANNINQSHAYPTGATAAGKPMGPGQGQSPHMMQQGQRAPMLSQGMQGQMSMQQGRMNPMGPGNGQPMQQQQMQMQGGVRSNMISSQGMQQGMMRGNIPGGPQGMQGVGMQRPQGQQMSMQMQGGQQMMRGGSMNPGMNPQQQSGSLLSNFQSNPQGGLLMGGNSGGVMKGMGVQQIPSISSLTAGSTTGMLLPSVVSGMGGGVGMPMQLPSMSTLSSNLSTPQWMNKSASSSPIPGSAPGSAPRPGFPVTQQQQTGGPISNVPASASKTNIATTTTTTTATTTTNAVTANSSPTPMTTNTNTTYVENKSDDTNKRQKI